MNVDKTRIETDKFGLVEVAARSMREVPFSFVSGSWSKPGKQGIATITVIANGRGRDAQGRRAHFP